MGLTDRRMGHPTDIEHEVLRHARGLRTMARALVRDAHAADDAVQDTLCQALRHEPEPGPMGGWLARTLQNFTRQRHRADRRRANREHIAAGREPANRESDPAAAAGRREILRHVTDAVLELDEPYQTTVFLRYFEDLPPRAIARRTGAKIATVKSRLQRGLGMLRARLDQRSGGQRRQWRLALAGAFALPTTGTGVAVTSTGTLLGPLLMGTTTKLAVAAGAITTISIVLFATGSDPTPPTGGAPAPGGTPPAAMAAQVAGNAEPANELVRDAATTPKPAIADLVHPFELTLDVRFVDDLGLPVEGERLAIGPRDGVLNQSEDSSGADGRLRVTVPARTPSAKFVITDDTGALREIELHADRAAAIAVLAPRKSRRYMRSATLTLVRSFQNVRYTIHTPGRRPRMAAGLHPGARFSIPAHREAPVGSSPINLSTTDTGQMIFYGRVDVEKPEADDATAEAPAKAAVAGTVFDAAGEPAKKTTVALMLGEQLVATTETNEHGEYEFTDLQAAEFTVRAGGDRHGLAALPAVTVAGTGTTPVDLHLALGASIAGRALGVDGTPIADAPVVWRADDGSWCTRTKTDKDGTFVLANLPGALGTITLWTKQGGLPIAAAREVLPGGGETVLQVTGASTLSLRPTADEPLSSALSIRVWDTEHGVGTVLEVPDKGKPWRLPRLPAGFYRVELFHPLTGTLDAGRHWADGSNDCDLGVVELGRPGLVRIDAARRDPAAVEPVSSDTGSSDAGSSDAGSIDNGPIDLSTIVDGRFDLVPTEIVTVPGQIEADATGARIALPDEWELYRIAGDVDRRIALSSSDANDGEFRLAPGDYVWLTASPGGPHETRFTVTAGRETTFALPR